MSGHLRFGIAAFLVAAGFSTPAASDPLTDLFSPSPAPAAATAPPAPAPDACLRQPGPAAAGQHWVYRHDGGRRCWFQVAEDAAAKKVVRHHVERRRAAAPEENDKAVEDAHDEAVSPAPAPTPQPASASQPAQAPQPTQASQTADPAPAVRIVHTVPVRLTDAAGVAPPAPVQATQGADQQTSDQPAPRQLDANRLLAAASAARDEPAAAPPAPPIAAPAANTGAGGGWAPSWLGVLLIALGGAVLLSASGTLRRVFRPDRFPDTRPELPVIAPGGEGDLSFARRAARRPVAVQRRV